MLRSEVTEAMAGDICLKLLFAILTKNASFRQRLLRAHILNINMRTYISSAHGHEKDALFSLIPKLLHYIYIHNYDTMIIQVYY